ncbi:hypothetical protein MKX29_24035 [Cytobacillus sp. FSL R7-0696]|uniref:hypothetical protein n=1 Tax=Cytobacillus sp. FSL R7-0696 TaxID=2921691 RepID=UPI0030FAEE67
MYEVILYVEGDSHFAKVDYDGLEELREGLNNDNAPTFVEVFCFDGDCAFGINREKVVAFTYKEVSE